jgi:hypothetical protein
MTGSPVDASVSTFSGTGTTATATSITTTVNKTRIILVDQNWDASGNHVPPFEFVERQEFLTTLNDVAKDAAGATGNRGPYTTGTIGTNPWQGWMFALKPMVGSVVVTMQGAKVWSGSAWVEKPAKVWSGSAWVTKPMKIWNGSAWV